MFVAVLNPGLELEGFDLAKNGRPNSRKGHPTVTEGWGGGGGNVWGPTTKNHTLGFQRPLKEWSRSLDCFCRKTDFLRLALNIQKTMSFVARELLGVRSLKVTPSSSSQLQITAPKPLIPWLAKCMVASLFKIARCPAYCRGVHGFFACWY